MGGGRKKGEFMKQKGLKGRKNSYHEVYLFRSFQLVKFRVTPLHIETLFLLQCVTSISNINNTKGSRKVFLHLALTAIMQVFVDSTCPSFLVKMFMLPGVVINGGFTNVKSITTHTRKFVNNPGSELFRNGIFWGKVLPNFKWCEWNPNLGGFT